MEILIQDPTYSKSMRFGEALIDACKKGKNGAAAFAFAERNGIVLFLGDPEFEKYIKKYKFILVVGTDSITDPEAIAVLRKYKTKYKNLSVFAYIHDSRRYLFHPKAIMFEMDNGGISFIGSGNLTERGLFHNVEMFGYGNLTPTEFSSNKKQWGDWFEHSVLNNFIFEIDDPIVDHAANLSAGKKKRLFSARKTTKKKSTGIVITASLKALYKKQAQSISIVKPKRKTSVGKPAAAPASKVIAKPVPKVKPVDSVQSENPVWKVSREDRILIAEIPKSGSRWKQVNFDKDSFENYFGATAGGESGTYRVLLKNVDKDGALGETESRPSVSVASQNYRFEIEAASGLEYPKGSKRPYVIFAEVSARSFMYELFMPGDAMYGEVDEYVEAWKIATKKTGIARIITETDKIRGQISNIGLWKV